MWRWDIVLPFSMDEDGSILTTTKQTNFKFRVLIVSMNLIYLKVFFWIAVIIFLWVLLIARQFIILLFECAHVHFIIMQVLSRRNREMKTLVWWGLNKHEYSNHQRHLWGKLGMLIYNKSFNTSRHSSAKTFHREFFFRREILWRQMTKILNVSLWNLGTASIFVPPIHVYRRAKLFAFASLPSICPPPAPVLPVPIFRLPPVVFTITNKISPYYFKNRT